MGNGVKYETEIRRIGEFQTPDMQAMFAIVHCVQYAEKAPSSSCRKLYAM